MQERYRSVRSPAQHELERIQGSRFLARVAPCSSREQALALVDAARAAHPAARHHCFAWRLGPSGADSFSNDAGEPAGSAGRPILQQLEGQGLGDVALVVTRYFGGVKLGVGGLMRAYGGAAAAVLARAELVEVEITRRARITHPYECSGAIEAWLAAEGLAPRSARYDAQVQLEVDLPVGRLARSLAELGERSAGRARVELD